MRVLLRYLAAIDAVGRCWPGADGSQEGEELNDVVGLHVDDDGDGMVVRLCISTFVKS